MFRNFTNRDLAIIAILLDEDEAKRKKQKRLWVHKMLKKRNIEGEYHTLYKELVDDEKKFFQYFRMSKYKFYYLLDKIQADIQKQNTTFREAISPREKLAVCLRFLATGDSYRTIATSYRLGHSTVKYIVEEVCKAIIRRLKSEVMPFPNEDQWRNIASDFWLLWNFPNCLGAIDGKHVVIEAPANSGSQYFNYKKTFSIVLLALVNAHYQFIAVDIGSYGKNSDGGIFSNSQLGKLLASGNCNVPNDVDLPNTNNDPVPFVIIGDEAFPLKTYLLRPYPGSQLDNQKKIFNYRLSRARNISEDTFGILSQKFRIYQRRLKLHPKNADIIIFTTCILHNFIKDRPENINILRETDFVADNLIRIPRQGGSASTSAFEIREKYKTFFSSEQGRIEWQNNIFLV